jgi:hypothetical protein
MSERNENEREYLLPRANGDVSPWRLLACVAVAMLVSVRVGVWGVRTDGHLRLERRLLEVGPPDDLR